MNENVVEVKDDEILAEICDGVEVEDEPNDHVKDEKEPEVVPGIVVDCVMLNVREKPMSSARVVCKLPCWTKVAIDERGSTPQFYKIYTATGIEGFCMKQYIALAK